MAEKIVGGFSYPSTMPCLAWGIPARRCRIGSVLAQKEGTVCITLAEKLARPRGELRSGIPP
jgi:hypothetical protein